MSMYEEFSVLRDKDLDLDSLRKEVDFYKSENALLKLDQLINLGQLQKTLYSEDHTSYQAHLNM